MIKETALFDSDSFHVTNTYLGNIKNEKNNYNVIDFTHYTNITLAKDFMKASGKTSPRISLEYKNTPFQMLSSKPYEVKMIEQLFDDYDKEPPIKKQRKLVN